MRGHGEEKKHKLIIQAPTRFAQIQNYQFKIITLFFEFCILNFEFPKGRGAFQFEFLRNANFEFPERECVPVRASFGGRTGAAVP